MSDVLVCDDNGFTIAPILVAPALSFKVILAGTGEYVACPDRSTACDMARALTLNVLGFKETHSIEPVPPDGFCGYAACEIGNSFHHQVMGPELVAMRTALTSWIQHDLIMEDWSIDGKHHCPGDDGDTIPILALKVYITCDPIAPFATVHLLVWSGAMPGLETYTHLEALQMIRRYECPILLLYEFINHPQIGGDQNGRHFETMLPSAQFLKEKVKAEKQMKKQEQQHKKFAMSQAEGFASMFSDAGSSSAEPAAKKQKE